MSQDYGSPFPFMNTGIQMEETQDQTGTQDQYPQVDTPQFQQQQQQQPQPQQYDLQTIFALLLQQNQALINMTQQQAQQLQTQQQSFQTTNSAHSQQQLPVFKAPTVQPPTFDGKTYTRPAQEAQATIDDYIHQCENKARFYNLRADGNPILFTGHLTYTQWVILGLKDYASEQWRLLPDDRRNNMTWKEFTDWIRTTFTSPMTLQQAISALDQIKQTKSALMYVQEFNRLLAALESQQIKLPALYHCTKFKNGLKAHLQNNATLFGIDQDLPTLQKEAIRLDTINWELTKKTRDHPNSHFKPTPRPSTSTNHTPTPMELDNTERFKKLTDTEREHYKKNNWCTFCRQKDHTIDKCERRKQFNAQKPNNHGNRHGFKQGDTKRQLNNVTTTTSGTNTTTTAKTVNFADTSPTIQDSSQRV